MNSIDDFVTLIRAEIGLDVTAENVGASLDEVPGWDSVHLLTLMTVLERETHRRISLPAVLEAPTLERIYQIAIA